MDKTADSKYIHRDILRRHFLSCKMRGDKPIPEKQKRGRRKCACDRCAAMKSACDRQRPCNTCKNSDAACTWDRVQGETELPRTDMPPTDLREGSEFSSASSELPLIPQYSQAEVETWNIDDPVGGAEPSLPDNLTYSTKIRNQTATTTFEKMSVPFLANFVSRDSRSLAEMFGYSNFAPDPPPKLVEPPSQSLFQTTGTSRLCLYNLRLLGKLFSVGLMLIYL